MSFQDFFLHVQCQSFTFHSRIKVYTYDSIPRSADQFFEFRISVTQPSSAAYLWFASRCSACLWSFLQTVITDAPASWRVFLTCQCLCFFMVRILQSSTEEVFLGIPGPLWSPSALLNYVPQLILVSLRFGWDILWLFFISCFSAS